MEKINPRELQLILMPARNPTKAFWGPYEKAYGLWQEVWGGFWHAMQKPCYADSFTRQDDLCAIFYQEHCIALTLQYVVNLCLTANQDDSYFSGVWLKTNLPYLEPYLPDIYCGNSITTSPQFRRNRCGFSLKDVLLGACVNCFLEHESCKAMVGSMRRERGVTDLAKRFGANLVTSYFSDTYQFDLDLVVFERSSVTPCLDPQAADIVQSLWESRIDARKSGRMTLLKQAA